MRRTTRQYVYGPPDWSLTCDRCGKPIHPGEAADVTEDADEYAGATHPTC